MSETQTTAAPVTDADKKAIITDAAQPFLGLVRDVEKLPDNAMKSVYQEGAFAVVEHLAQRLGVSLENLVSDGASMTDSIHSLITKAFTRAGMVTEKGEVMTAGALNDLKAAATRPADAATVTAAETVPVEMPATDAPAQANPVAEPAVTTGGEVQHETADVIDNHIGDASQQIQS